MCKTIMCETVDSRTLSRDGGSGSGSGGSGGGDGVLESEPLVSREESAKKSSELWHIHGRHFDLSGFLRHHPGGSSILEATKGAEDITPLFESYHALAHTAAIRQTLEKFLWTGKLVDDVAEREAALVGGGAGKEPVRYRWDEGGFYAVLTCRVKRHFLEKHGQGELDPRKASVNRFVKAPMTWYLKELVIVAAYVPLFLYMLGYDVVFRGGVSLPAWARAGAAFLAGAVLQSFSFCTLHDASHYGLLFKKPRAQEVISRVCNAWTLWHHGLWVMHHVYGHHSFTGDPERDPDLVHARPYFRKSLLAPKEQYDPFLVRWQRFLAPLFLMVLPGATLGQSQGYLRALRDGNLWHVSITKASEQTLWYEYLTYVLALGSHVLGGNVWVSFCYFMGISVSYHLCVAPDHDTFESSVVNSIETKREEEGRRKREEREGGRVPGGSMASGTGGGGGSGGGGDAGMSSNRNNTSGTGSGNDSSSRSSSNRNRNGSIHYSMNSYSSNSNANNTSSTSTSSGNSSGGSGSSSGSDRIGRGFGESGSGGNGGVGVGGADELGHVQERVGQDQAGNGGSSHGGCGDSGGSNSSRRVSYSNSVGVAGGGGGEGGGTSGQAETEKLPERQEEENEGDDWGEVQVRHSGNFSNGNPLVTHAMGGINYQIEHHLFPSVSHMLYGEIAPIVRDACREFHVPYNSHSSLWSAYKSYLKHLMLCSEMSGGP